MQLPLTKTFISSSSTMRGMTRRPSFSENSISAHSSSLKYLVERLRDEVQPRGLIELQSGSRSRAAAFLRLVSRRTVLVSPTARDVCRGLDALR